MTLTRTDLRAIHSEAEIASLVSAVLAALLDAGSKHAAVESLLVLAGEASRYRAWQNQRERDATLRTLIERPIATTRIAAPSGSQSTVHAASVGPDRCPRCTAGAPQ